MATALRQLRATAAIAVLTPQPLFRRSYAFGYTQAKALVHSQYGAPADVLSLHSHSLAPAYGDEILVRFLASPINPADINQVEGVYPSKPPMTIALGTAVPCAVPGSEGVVEVVSTGNNVSDFAVGDRAVMKHSAFGTWRTHALAHSKNLLKLPAGEEFSRISAQQAATVSVNPCTAYQMLREFTPLRRGDWFIQNGANSGVGRAAIQLARNWGLKSVNIVRSRPEPAQSELKKELTDLGADLVITEAGLSSRNRRNELKELTKEAGGLRLALNCVGGKNASDMVRQLAEGAHLVTYGGMARQPVTFSVSSFIFKDLHAHGFWISRWSDANPEKKMDMVKDIFGMMLRGEFEQPPVQETVWNSDTTEETLKEAVVRSGQGYGGKKEVFVFES